MKTNPNDSLYSETTTVGDISITTNGLTKREYFAAMALQGLLARGAYANDAAKQAVLFVDELINELNKEKTNE